MKEQKHSFSIRRLDDQRYMDRYIEDAEHALKNKLWESVKDGQSYTVRIVKNDYPESIQMDLRVGIIQPVHMNFKMPKKMGVLKRIISAYRLLRTGELPLEIG